LSEGVCVHGRPSELLPSELVSLLLRIEARVQTLREWEYFDASFVPVSQNFVGEPVRIYFQSDIDKFIAMRELKNQLSTLGFNVDDLGTLGMF
jgi:hypothetical protein